ncbi:hypothetical protein NDU88_006577 [Pleurodeles waltl]|uniref:Uncharacterized protein n=1 Tax=Pleurodeles waltl TaxID=8319 RepID=A0AAV7MMQ7_PLEWA|nr:hypothetical protein NDU88_006577 [Pleurodeles waltl]
MLLQRPIDTAVVVDTAAYLQATTAQQQPLNRGARAVALSPASAPLSFKSPLTRSDHPQRYKLCSRGEIPHAARSRAVIDRYCPARDSADTYQIERGLQQEHGIPVHSLHPPGSKFLRCACALPLVSTAHRSSRAHPL